MRRDFLKTVTRNNEGRLIVQLPIKTNKLITLGDSRDTALRRFKALEKRLLKQSNTYVEYKKFMREYQELEYMHQIDHLESESSKPSYYFPHYCVHRETSTTTKLRVYLMVLVKLPRVFHYMTY